MNSFFSNLKSVGFDLDQTLYPKNSEIDGLIRNKIAKEILKKNPELDNIQKVREIYDKKYLEVGSWTKIFKDIGFKNPKQVVYECLLNANFVDLIKKDNKLVEIMQSLYKKYSIFLITASPKDFSICKLEKIGINPKLFQYAIFGDKKGFTSKIDKRVFEDFLDKSPYLPEQHVYIGDSLKVDILPSKSVGMKTIAVGEKIPEADFSIKRIHNIEKLLL